MKITGINDPRLLIIFILILIVFLGKVPTISSVILENKNEKIIVPEQPANPTEAVYTVEPGDSLYKIAAKYKVHLWQLREWNNLSFDTHLQPGQNIIIKYIAYSPAEGLASWYGPGFHGQNMANGEVYDMHEIIVAHRTLPLGRKVRVTNLENSKSIIAPVLDRGPYIKNSHNEYAREIDISYAVAIELGTIKKGVVLARIEPINEPLPLD